MFDDALQRCLRVAWITALVTALACGIAGWVIAARYHEGQARWSLETAVLAAFFAFILAFCFGAFSLLAIERSGRNSLSAVNIALSVVAVLALSAASAFACSNSLYWLNEDWTGVCGVHGIVPRTLYTLNTAIEQGGASKSRVAMLIRYRDVVCPNTGKIVDEDVVFQKSI